MRAFRKQRVVDSGLPSALAGPHPAAVATAAGAAEVGHSSVYGLLRGSSPPVGGVVTLSVAELLSLIHTQHQHPPQDLVSSTASVRVLPASVPVAVTPRVSSAPSSAAAPFSTAAALAQASDASSIHSSDRETGPRAIPAASDAAGSDETERPSNKTRARPDDPRTSDDRLEHGLTSDGASAGALESKIESVIESVLCRLLGTSLPEMAPVPQHPQSNAETRNARQAESSGQNSGVAPPVDSLTRTAGEAGPAQPTRSPLGVMEAVPQAEVQSMRTASSQVAAPERLHAVPRSRHQPVPQLQPVMPISEPAVPPAGATLFRQRAVQSTASTPSTSVGSTPRQWQQERLVAQHATMPVALSAESASLSVHAAAAEYDVPQPPSLSVLHAVRRGRGHPGVGTVASRRFGDNDSMNFSGFQGGAAVPELVTRQKRVLAPSHEASVSMNVIADPRPDGVVQRPSLAGSASLLVQGAAAPQDENVSRLAVGDQTSLDTSAALLNEIHNVLRKYHMDLPPSSAPVLHHQAAARALQAHERPGLDAPPAGLVESLPLLSTANWKPQPAAADAALQGDGTVPHGTLVSGWSGSAVNVWEEDWQSPLPATQPRRVDGSLLVDSLPRPRRLSIPHSSDESFGSAAAVPSAMQRGGPARRSTAGREGRKPSPQQDTMPQDFYLDEPPPLRPQAVSAAGKASLQAAPATVLQDPPYFMTSSTFAFSKSSPMKRLSRPFVMEQVVSGEVRR